LVDRAFAVLALVVLEASSDVIRLGYECTNKEDTMTAAQFSLLAATIFGLVAIAQIVRAITRLPITIGRTSIPIWASWVACAVAIILAWLGYSASHA
jgi:protein-S-isoprenylcysteine O-methyltransferase Ste14